MYIVVMYIHVADRLLCMLNISSKLSYSTSSYAYRLIWEKNRASPGFHWDMENLSEDNEQ